MKKIHLALLFVVMLICFGIFFYQMNNELETVIVFNETKTYLKRVEFNLKVYDALYK